MMFFSFFSSLNMTVEHANMVVLACCILHNYLRKTCAPVYAPPGYGDWVDPQGEVIAGEWRADQANLLDGIAGSVARNPSLTAVDVRERFMNFFSGPGALDWQDRHVNRT